MNIQFPFRIRLGMDVAYAIGEEVETNMRCGHPFGFTEGPAIRPTLISIRKAGDKDVFHFEGGTVVSLRLVDLNSFPSYSHGDNQPLQEWILVSANVRYYPNCRYVGDGKISETWGSEKLLQLKAKRWWHSPNVRDISTITGVVAVFWDNAAADGFTEVDPSFLQEGHYSVQEEFTYARLIPGDRERAKKEANARLAEYYR